MPALLQSKVFDDSPTAPTVSVTFDNPVVVTSLIHVTVNWFIGAADDPLISQCKDTRGNAFSHPVNYHAYDTFSKVVSEQWYGKVTTGGTDTVTVTLPATHAFHRIIVAEFSGIDLSTPVNASAITNSQQALEGTDAFVTAPITTDKNGCLLVASAIDGGAAFNSIVPGTGFATLGTTSAIDVSAEYRVQQLAALTQGTFTITDGARLDRCSSMIVAYNALPDPPPFVPLGRGASW